MANDNRYLEIAFDRYSEEERRELHKCLVNVGFTLNNVLGELDILIDRDQYIQKKTSYVILHEYRDSLADPIDFSDMKINTSKNMVDIFDNGDIAIHMLEIPLKEVPLYLNSEDDLVVATAKWRLKKGR